VVCRCWPLVWRQQAARQWNSEWEASGWSGPGAALPGAERSAAADDVLCLLALLMPICKAVLAALSRPGRLLTRPRRVSGVPLIGLPALRFVAGDRGQQRGAMGLVAQPSDAALDSSCQARWWPMSCGLARCSVRRDSESLAIEPMMPLPRANRRP